MMKKITVKKLLKAAKLHTDSITIRRVKNMKIMKDNEIALVKEILKN